MSSGKKDKFSNTPAFDRMTQMIAGSQFGPDLAKAAMDRAERSQRAMSQAMSGFTDPLAEALQRSQKFDAVALASIQETVIPPAICQSPSGITDIGIAGKLTSSGPNIDQKIIDMINKTNYESDQFTWMEMERIKRDSLYRIYDLKEQYAISNNPICPLEALHICLLYGQDIPDWVKEYMVSSLRSVIGVLVEVADGGKAGREADRIGRAFGFSDRGQGRNKGYFSEMTKQKFSKERNYEIYSAVCNEIEKKYRKEDGTIKRFKLEYLCSDVGELYNLSGKSVMRIYKAVGDAIRSQRGD